MHHEKPLDVARAPTTSTDQVCDQDDTDRKDEADIFEHIVAAGMLAPTRGEIFARIPPVAVLFSIEFFTATVQYLVLGSLGHGLYAIRTAAGNRLQGKGECLSCAC